MNLVDDFRPLLVAALALTLSAAQWIQSQQTNRLKLLLGDRESAGARQ